LTFTLDTSRLGGSEFNYVETIIEDRGRSIILDWSQSGSDQDMEIFGFSIRFYPGEEHAQEQS
jgi:hypothetical protein